MTSIELILTLVQSIYIYYECITLILTYLPLFDSWAVTTIPSKINKATCQMVGLIFFPVHIQTHKEIQSHFPKIRENMLNIVTKLLYLVIPRGVFYLLQTKRDNMLCVSGHYLQTKRKRLSL